MVKISYDNLYARCEGPPEELSQINLLLTYSVKGARYAEAYKKGRWDGRATMFNSTWRYFPVGLLNYVITKLPYIEFECKCTIQQDSDNRSYREISLLRNKLRDYQKGGVSEFLKQRRGIIRLSTRSGKCCHGDSFVSTDIGLKKIKDVQIGDTVKTFLGYSTVEKVYNMGESETFIIEANKAYSIEGTPEHPLLSIRNGGLDWVEMKDLAVGDYVLMGREESSSKEETEDTISRLLGYLIADGGLSTRQPNFTNDDVDIKNDFTSILKSLNISWRESNNNNNGSIIFHLHGGESFAKYLEEKLGLHLVRSRFKEVPEYVLKSDDRMKEFLRAYLSCEGNFSKKKNEFTFSSSSKKLVNQICTMLLRFGIVCQGRIKRIKDHDYYEVRILRTSTDKLLQLNLITNKKKELPKLDFDKYYTNVDTVPLPEMLGAIKIMNKNIPLREWDNSIGKKGANQYFYGKRFPSYKKLGQFLTVDDTTVPGQLFEVYVSQPFFAKVTSIERGKATVYDITVKEDHHYVANGFYSHNTVIGIACTQAIWEPTLFVVHTKDLLNQTIKEYETELGIRIGKIGDGFWEPDFITVATIQTLSRGLNNKNTFEMFSGFLRSRRFVIFDEVHRASNTYQKVSRFMPNAEYRLGLSATALIGSKENKFQSMALTGPIIYEVKTKKLLDDKYIAKPIVTFIDVPWEGEELYGMWDTIYDQGIVNNEDRNYLVCFAAVTMINQGLNPLILVEKKEHGEILERILLSESKKVKYVHGGHTSQERKRALDDLQIGNLDAIISTRIFNEGINIVNLKGVIIASGYKAASLCYQRYGRGITRTPDKEVTYIVDFIDNANSILYNHSMERMAVCRKDKAFELRITSSDEVLEKWGVTNE